MKKVIIDTDTGIDDALALILALRSSELAIEAITTVSGNAHVDLCTRNVLLIMEQLGAERLPIVAGGEAQPLVRPLLTAPEVHGRDGIGNITEFVDDSGARIYPEPRPLYSTEPAPDVLVRLTREQGPDLTVITLGPLTNLARAIEIDRQAMGRLKEIVIMGGAFRVYGNTSLAAEYNFYVDPEAAAIVTNLDVTKTIVPLDVTERVTLLRDMLESSLSDHQTAILRLVRDISSFCMDFHLEHFGIDGCFMHDPLTVAAVIDPSLLETVGTGVFVETKGEFTSGMTLAELRPDRLPDQNDTHVAVSVDSEQFLKFFMERIIG